MSVTFLFECSDRETEELATYHLPAKFFLHIPIDEHAPDHSSISRFRDALLALHSADHCYELFRHIIVEAKKKGIAFGTI